MGNIVGASVEELRALARSMVSTADAFDGIKVSLSAALSQTRWTGSDAEMTRAAWDGTLSKRLDGCAESLREAAGKLEDQASQQEVASAEASAASASVSQRRGDRKLDDPDMRERDRGFGIGGFRPFAALYDDKTDMRDVPLFAVDVSRPSSDAIDPSDATQGGVGDCYFIAALSSMAATEQGRQAIRDVLTDNGDGTFTVTFADGQRVTVDDDFYVEDSDVRYADRGNDIWAMVMEKALAAREGGYQDIEGGYSNEVFTLLGLEGRLSGMSSLSDDQLASILTSDRPVALDATMANLGSQSGGNHAISVVGSTRDEDGNVFVELRNPWGAPVGGSLPMSTDGTFQMSLDDVRRTFYAVEWVES